MVQWAKGFQLKQQVACSNSKLYLARVRNPTSLWGSHWPAYQIIINLFNATGLFFTPPENIRKPYFLMFSGVIERDQWPEMVNKGSDQHQVSKAVPSAKAESKLWRLRLETVFLNFKIAICDAKDFCSLYLVCLCVFLKRCSIIKSIPNYASSTDISANSFPSFHIFWVSFYEKSLD